MHSNIYLIGFMGSGKTTVGLELSRRIGYAFIDVDQQIESVERKTIASIFQDEGEAAFRELESGYLKKISEHIHHVVSTGGGVILREQNVANMKQTGRIILLDVEPKTVVNRLGADQTRPLLQGADRYDKICSLMASRKASYQASADIRVVTDGFSVEDVVTRIIEHLEILSESGPS